MKDFVKKSLRLLIFIISLPFLLVFNRFFISFIKVFVNEIRNVNFRWALKKHGKNININSNNKFEGLKYISIGDNFSSQSGLWLGAYDKYYGRKYNPSIYIGNNVHFSKNCHISAIKNVTIADNVLLGSNIMINDNSHGNTDDLSKSRYMLPLETKGEIYIGENTFIGDNTVVLSGVRLGKNCVVGANSVVNKSFPDNSIIAGAPAKLIRKIGEEKNE